MDGPDGTQRATNGTIDATTTNKYLLIDTDEPFVLRAMSDYRTTYGIVVYLIRKNPDPNQHQDDGPVYPMKLFTSQASDLSQATAMIFAPAPNGYYYSISILNRGEDTTTSTGKPPFTCEPGVNGLKTKCDIMYSLKSCDAVACNGEIIVVTSDGVGPFPPYSSTGRVRPYVHILLSAMSFLIGYSL